MRKSSSGQNLLEFCLIGGLIAVISIAALTILGGNVTSTYNGTKDAIALNKPFQFGNPASVSTSQAQAQSS